jgi:hypothetical protein
MLLDCHVEKQAWRTKAAQRNGASKAPERLHGANAALTEVPDAGPRESAVRKLVDFQHLGENWDGLGAQAPSHELLASATGLAYTLHEQGLDRPNCVVAGVDGSITFEWHDANGTYTEVEIVRPLFAEVMMIEPGQPPRHWTLPTEQTPSLA